MSRPHWFNVAPPRLDVLLFVFFSTLHLATSLEAGGKSLRRQQQLASATVAQPGNEEPQPLSGSSIMYLSALLEKFTAYAHNAWSVSEQRHATEDHRLALAEGATYDPSVKAALEESRTNNQASQIEAHRVFHDIEKFADTLETVMGAAQKGGSGKGCETVTCGQHASCTRTTLGAQCVCDEGFIGDGLHCAAPSSFLPQHLLVDGALGRSRKVADLTVTHFMGQKLAIAWRDVTHKEQGVMMLGKANAGGVEWAPPERFTEQGGKAFDPQIVGLPSNRVAVIYRDENREGTGWLRAGEIGVSGVRGADMHITWGKPLTLCRNQPHKMALVSLPGNKVATLYSDHIAATETKPKESFGNTAMVSIGAKGEAEILGNVRFVEKAVTRVEVTQLTPASFVVAYRAGKEVDEMDTSVITRQEADAIYGEADGDDLVFDPHPLHLEPDHQQIWSRGISLIGMNTLAYAYQMGEDEKTKLAIIRVDPTTHRMKVVDGPYVIHEGFTPYVSMVNLAYAPVDPHTVTYYQPNKVGTLNICRVQPASGKLYRCQDFPWMNQQLGSVSGISLGGGRMLFAFTDMQGVPYYQMFGLAKK